MDKNDDNDSDILTQTTEESGLIKNISKGDVHKICSGQVILNLATAVKELIENSIDAGATNIEVKLKEQGCSLIEVSDNGCGVEERNFEGLAAKYSTSKLREFSDLSAVETYGFRGEALSSLCALSEMTITTRHQTANHACKLVLDNFGTIKSKTPCARSVGTTVSLANLFHSLPVRKKEFHKNSKREFTKMCQIVQAYCLVMENIRISCSNQESNGARKIVINSLGGSSVMDNITTIFGPKQGNDLIKLKPAILKSGVQTDTSMIADESTDEVFELSQEEVDKLNLSRFQLDGYVSSCEHGKGRSTKDRQFFYVNSRPCEPEMISKMVNETYHKYNHAQYPFVFLNLKMKREDVDVNVTPDKRQIFISNEKIMLLALKKSLINTFGPIPSTFKHQNLDLTKSFIKQASSTKLDKSFDDDDLENTLTQSNSSKFAAMLSQWKATGSTDGPCSPPKGSKKRARDYETLMRTMKIKKIQDYMNVVPVNQKLEEKEYVASYKSESEDERENEDDEKPYKHKVIEATKSWGLNDDILTPPKSMENDEKHASDNLNVSEVEKALSFTIEIVCSEAPIESHKIECKNVEPLKSDEKILQFETIEVESYEPSQLVSREFSIATSIEEIASKMQLEEEKEEEIKEKNECKFERLKFKAEINPSNNKAAEDELQTEITKSMFQKMEIIGQFNLGFIVAKLEDDLFIIDQHATDEKYNFEELQKSTTIQNQKLVIPQPLELNAVNELILIDNLDIFELNGFEFEVDGTAEPTKKVKLVAKPMSKAWEFGKEDIDELIFMLQDAPNTICRPSRIRAMFASRACRKSVMIGTALSKKEMRKLVNHMGEIEQPWNCPHGRPTMRHLVNLKMLQNGGDDK